MGHKSRKTPIFILLNCIIFIIFIFNIGCTFKTNSSWIDAAPTSAKELGLVIKNLDRSEVEQVLLETQLNARLVSSFSGTYEFTNISKKDLSELFPEQKVYKNELSFYAVPTPLEWNKNEPEKTLSAQHFNEAFFLLNNVWDKTQGANQTVAIIDTGINFLHPDLLHAQFINSQEIPNNGIDDDGNGYIDDSSGWNFAINSYQAYDNFGHGTQVAGLIAGSRTGVSPKSKILNLRVMSRVNTIDDASVAAAIEYAIWAQADIINISLGSYKKPSDLVLEALEQAAEKGILIVAAAGNLNQSCEQKPAFPAALNLKNIISVIATELESPYRRASYSNYGTCYLLAAQGGNKNEGLTTTSAYFTENAYSQFNGTSAATPIVSGTIALIKSARPELSTEQIRHVLLSSSLKLAHHKNQSQTEAVLIPALTIDELYKY